MIRGRARKGLGHRSRREKTTGVVGEAVPPASAQDLAGRRRIDANADLGKDSQRRLVHAFACPPT